MMKETPWKEYREGGRTYRIKVQYGIDYDFGRRNSQAPYFSITCSLDEKLGNGRWRGFGGGANHVEIARKFPTLASYIKWHLVSTEAPMHYIANAKYWWEMVMGRRQPDKHQRVDPRDAFNSTIILGGIPGESMPYTDDWADVERWLHNRLPKLMGYFAADMTALGVLE
jgi:hypothetical protein